MAQHQHSFGDTFFGVVGGQFRSLQKLQLVLKTSRESSKPQVRSQEQYCSISFQFSFKNFVGDDVYGSETGGGMRRMEMLPWNSKYDTNAHMVFIFLHQPSRTRALQPPSCLEWPFSGLQYEWVQVSLPWVHVQQSHWCPNAHSCCAFLSPTPTSPWTCPLELARPPQQ